MPAQQPKVAYRPLDSSIFLERVLCFKHTRQVARDSTVKFQWRTLQLLPGQDRPSYAGAKVEVLEQSGGQLMVRYDGEVIPHQEVPPRPGAWRASNGALAPTPELAQVVRNLAQHGLSRLQLQRLAALEAAVPQRQEDVEPLRPDTPPPREASPRKQALWKAIHHARLQGVSLRDIAKQLGISRNTVRKYVDLPTPPVNRTRRTGRLLGNSGQDQRTFSLNTYPDIFAGHRHSRPAIEGISPPVMLPTPAEPHTPSTAHGADKAFLCAHTLGLESSGSSGHSESLGVGTPRRIK